MNFTILGPSEGNLSENKSDMTDARFGGQRKVVSKSVADDKDYTKRTGQAPNRKENPVDEAVRDVDDMSDVNDNFVDPTTERAKKREFSRREETANVQKSNNSIGVQSDSDRRPSEETDAFEPDTSDPNFLVKSRRSKLKGHFGGGQYDNNPNRGTYEGEIS